MVSQRMKFNIWTALCATSLHHAQWQTVDNLCRQIVWCMDKCQMDSHFLTFRTLWQSDIMAFILLLDKSTFPHSIVCVATTKTDLLFRIKWAIVARTIFAFIFIGSFRCRVFVLVFSNIRILRNDFCLYSIWNVFHADVRSMYWILMQLFVCVRLCHHYIFAFIVVWMFSVVVVVEILLY